MKGKGGFHLHFRPFSFTFIDKVKELFYRPKALTERKKMNNNQLEKEVQILKACLTDYVNMITIPSTKAGHGMYNCPLPDCTSGHGANGTGAFSITNDGLSWHCFSCNKHGDIFDLLELMEGITDFKEKKKKIFELFPTVKNLIGVANLNQPTKNTVKAEYQTQMQPAPSQPQTPAFDIKEYISKCCIQLSQTDYYQKRGLSKATIDKFYLGYNPHEKTAVIPYDLKGTYYIERYTEPHDNKGKYKKPSTSTAGSEPLFNSEALYSDSPCFICEGAFDVISLYEAFEGAFSVGLGGVGINRLLRQIEARKPKKPLIIALDNDDAGQTTAKKLKKELDKLGVKAIKAIFSYDKYTSGAKKDTNDLLLANKEQLAKDIKANIERAEMVSDKVQGARIINASEYLTTGGFEREIKDFQKYKDRKTGFKNLDQYFTMYNGLAVLGGSASLGKTTFAINWADNMIKAGETILYFALEQGQTELLSKVLARRAYTKCQYTSLTNTAIKSGVYQGQDINQAINALIAENKNDLKRLNIIKCDFSITAEEIKETIENFIFDTGITPIVIIDYLQLISTPQGFKGDTRASTDHVIKMLKTVQNDNQLFMLVISNFNRSSYDTPADYSAFKESGMIEYTADYVMALQLAVLEDTDFNYSIGTKGTLKETSTQTKRELISKAMSQYPKEVELVSLKNRNGQQNFKCFFNYYMKNDCFVESIHSIHDPQTRIKEMYENESFINASANKEEEPSQINYSDLLGNVKAV